MRYLGLFSWIGIILSFILMEWNYFNRFLLRGQGGYGLYLVVIVLLYTLPLIIFGGTALFSPTKRAIRQVARVSVVLLGLMLVLRIGRMAGIWPRMSNYSFSDLWGYVSLMGFIAAFIFFHFLSREGRIGGGENALIPLLVILLVNATFAVRLIIYIFSRLRFGGFIWDLPYLFSDIAISLFFLSLIVPQLRRMKRAELE
ncbi:MAG: hypothetical protein JXB45_03170 [Candidatus Krumholzibacteriota bacterium]|nr:hypothetical protein [Candidatus Krumholzibacteriota bacterium]